jgi:hypothetical protein
MKNNKSLVEQKSLLAKLMAAENISVEHKKIPTAAFDVKNRVLYLLMICSVPTKLVTHYGLPKMDGILLQVKKGKDTSPFLML